MRFGDTYTYTFVVIYRPILLVIYTTIQHGSGSPTSCWSPLIMKQKYCCGHLENWSAHFRSINIGWLHSVVVVVNISQCITSARVVSGVPIIDIESRDFPAICDTSARTFNHRLHFIPNHFSHCWEGNFNDFLGYSVKDYFYQAINSVYQWTFRLYIQPFT